MMAGNQYRQQWQQSPAPNQQSYQYDRRHDQRQWQENGRAQGVYTDNQEYQRYNEAPQDHRGYGGLGGQRTAPAPARRNNYDQDWQWQGQDQYSQGGYQNSYAEGRNGYHDQAYNEDIYHDQNHAPNRTYQYDDRYRSHNGQRKPPMQYNANGPDNLNQRGSPRHQRSDPPSPEKRSKTRERERLAANPTSPKSLAWDNPFGAFPKKSSERERRASLENGLNNLTINDYQQSSGDPEARPHTSHGHRGPPRKDPPRPTTAHDRSHDMVRPALQEYQIQPARGSADTHPPRQNFNSNGSGPTPQGYQTQPGRGSGDSGGQRRDFDPDSSRRPQEDYEPQSGRGQSYPDYQRQNPGREMGRRPVQGYQPQPGRGAADVGNQRQNYDADMGRRPGQNYQPPPSQGPDTSRPRQDVRTNQSTNSPANRRPVPEPRRGPPPQPMKQDLPHAQAYGSMSDYPSNGGLNIRGGYQPQSPRRQEYFTTNERYDNDYIPPSVPYESPNEPSPSRSAPRSIPQNNYRADPYGAEVPNPTPQYRGRDREVPNFDAIPPYANENPEDHVSPSPPASFNPQVYRKPTYQEPGSLPGPIDTTQNKPVPAKITDSPLAEFSFDLPPSGNNRPLTPSRNDVSAQAPLRGEYGGPRNFDSRAPPADGYGSVQTQPAPVSQYPPRAASRNGIKPPVGAAPPMPGNNQGYGSFGQAQTPVRPHTANSARSAPQNYDVGNPYDSEYADYRAPSAPAVSGPFNQAYNPAGGNQQYRMPFEQRAHPRGGSQDNYQGGGLRPKTSNSSHPVPVRVYPSANPTNTSAGTNANKSQVNVINNNPDALPAHPEPVRPGLSNGYNAAGSAQPVQPLSRPAPTTTPAPAPARPPSDSSGRNTPPVSIQELNQLRQMYSQNPGDHALGLRLAKRLVEGARVLSDEGGKADAKQTQKNRERYIFDAHKLVKKLVAANYAEAMFYLADCHGQGLLGLPVDAKEAFHLYQSAAKLGHAQSAYRVAVCCELGSEEGGGTRRDPMKAMQWYKRAATLGDTPAMYKLGMILLKGLLGQPKNPREGVSWLKRAAERADKDNPHALHELGLLYESTTPLDNIIRDEGYAFQLFQQAADLGYKYSQFRLGSAFEYGLLGCPIDARQSIAWYTRAAAQGEHQSELALSGWYLTGSEPLLTQSDTEAFLWARKAASSGLAKAEYAMGYFNEVGIGTAVDLEEAKRWYYRAASQNFAKARERLEELKRGQKMSKTRVSRSNVNRQSDGDCVVM
ncbi:hypothetical protein HRR83_002975 [Exophiala dermatitidis]|uniref:Chitin synthase regulatory factor 3 n=2 Tax=Exophiala dermatitidis TaxID=5970 RepID=H6BY59_EXODN|nr:uncharacterized protein HMPREF1120_05528 [Exophiala dermatitidis NIH/UT8656]KAJ4506802.1 hypothetical protein HRR73_008017 [Exophiala dermatitidis]EHY57495.1 hypothetical protein HMPREF1120_05528 [Exophiala dermatitidis NIH/UT8656]KAJ4516634.1 hypothetical protein HRR75_003291 [Exophiala dermatitidis]KAJ4520594.1 hypothetical protein HRR74_003592 [Exophiala dermatitidis]KAJ4537766.1 hypothetical protein HRR76_005753 [Exophiala dermatitidis]